MTTVRPRRARPKRAQVEGKLLWAVLVGLVSTNAAFAQQDRPAHWLHAGAMPPGAIGRHRLLRGGPLSPYNPLATYTQPVRLRVPQGTKVAPAAAGFAEGQAGDLLVGLQIGGVYRFRVTELPNHPGVEVFPTVELVDRLHPPPGKLLEFPVPIELTANELVLAAQGKFVTRIIYIEDPQLADAIARTPDQQQPWLEAAAGEDPLLLAQQLGRPIAILRMGGRVPDVAAGANHEFDFGGARPLVYDQAAIAKD